MSEPDTSTFQRRLAERRAQQVRDQADKALPLFEDDLVPSVEVYDGPHSASSAVDQVNSAVESIDIFEVYDRLYGGRRQDPRGRSDSVMAQCPRAACRPDEKQSAWFGINKTTNTWMLECGHGAGGWDALKLAGELYGLDSKSKDFWTIKKRLAKELRHVDYDLIVAQQTSAAPPTPATIEVPAAAEPTPWDQAVEDEYRRQLARETARIKVREYLASETFTPPESADSLADVLAGPEPEIAWTVHERHEAGTNTTITGGFKAGKSMLVNNLIRSLADGEPFLGEHTIRPLDGRIAYWNLELAEADVNRRFRSMNINKLDRIWLLNLRGKRLDISSDTAYEWVVKEMHRREIEAWVIDPYSGLFSGDENSNSDVAAFVKRLDQLKADAGIKDLFLPVHTGRTVEEGAERARGAAKLDDWADNRWIIARDKNSTERFFKNDHGRSPYAEERSLCFDPATNLLTYSAIGGTRKESAHRDAKGQVLAYIAANPGCGSRDIREGVPVRTELVSGVLRQLLADIDIETRKGKQNKIHHYIAGSAPIDVV